MDGRGSDPPEHVEARRKRWHAPVILTGYAVFYLLFFAKSLRSGNFIAPSDSLDFGLAAFLSEQHLWTDSLYSGYPIAADPQALMWYPPLRLLAALGEGWNLFLISPYIIASFTCFLFVRQLAHSLLAGLFAGLTYGFSGVLLAHMGVFNQLHVAAWLPLIPYGVLLIRWGRDKTGMLVTSIGLCLMVLAGHPQLVVYMLYLVGAYVVYHALTDPAPARRRLRVVLACGGAIALGFGLASIQLLPTAELASLSTRDEPSWRLFVRGSLPPWQLITLLFPLSFGGFSATPDSHVAYFGEGSPREMTGYVGLLPLFLAVFGVWHLDRLRGEAAFWLAAGSIAMLLTLGDATPLASAFFQLPLYGRFRIPARHFFLVAFCLSVAAGLVLSVVLAERRSWHIVRRSATSGAVAGALMLSAFLLLTPHVRALAVDRPLYLALACLLPAVMIVAIVATSAFAQRRLKSAAIFGGLLVALQGADMFAVHYVYPGNRLDYADVPVDEVALHARMVLLRHDLRRRDSRIVVADGTHNAFLLPNLTRAWDIPAVSGAGPMRLERYGEMTRMGGPGDVAAETFSTDHLAFDLLSVQYALVPEQWPAVDWNQVDTDRWTIVGRLIRVPDDPGTAYWLVRNNRPLPRAWLVHNVLRLNRNQILSAIRSRRFPDGTTFDPRDAALVETRAAGVGGSRSAVGTSCGTVSVARRSSSAREYLINAQTSCFLVMSEIFYPWWRASIDGKPVELVQTNYTLMGLAVPRGRSRVRLELFPTTVYAGIGVTALSAAVWLVLLLTLQKKEEKGVSW